MSLCSTMLYTPKKELLPTPNTPKTVASMHNIWRYTVSVAKGSALSCLETPSPKFSLLASLSNIPLPIELSMLE